MYGFLGLMAWPRAPRRYQPDWSDRPTGIATSAAAQGIGRSITPLAVWAGYWSLAAVLFVLPAQPHPHVRAERHRRHGARTAGLVRPLPHEPGNLFSTSGTQTAWILAILAVIVGLAPLVVRRPGVFLLAGAVFAFLLWIAGQGLVGNLFTGNDTDPNTGPVIILLAAAMTPTVIASRAEWRSPAGEVFRRTPAVGALGAFGLIAALAVAATLPGRHGGVDGQRHGRHGDGRQRQRQRRAARPRRTSPSRRRRAGRIRAGCRIAGLDLANSPEMAMGSSSQTVMNMNGDRRQRRGRLQHDEGQLALHRAPLPNAEAQTLLNEGNNAAPDIHMATSGCAARLTSSEDIGAQQYVQQTSAAVAQYAGPARRWRLDTWRRRPRTTRSCTTSTRRSWRRTQRPGGR